MNTPVIATRHGGPLDIIDEGRNGYFVEPQNAAELAALLTDMPPRATAEFRNDTVERFSLPAMTEATLAVYKEAVGLSCYP